MSKWIVVFRAGVEPEAIAEVCGDVVQAGGHIGHTYFKAKRPVLNGFSATLPTGFKEKLSDHPGIKYIEADKEVSIRMVAEPTSTATPVAECQQARLEAQRLRRTSWLRPPTKATGVSWPTRARVTQHDDELSLLRTLYTNEKAVNVVAAPATEKPAAPATEKPAAPATEKPAAPAAENPVAAVKPRKEKELPQAWQAGHYHYVGCPLDTPQNAGNAAECECRVRKATHSNRLQDLAALSKGSGRVRQATPASPAASSSSSSLSPSSSCEVASLQKAVLASLDSLESRVAAHLHGRQDRVLQGLSSLQQRTAALCEREGLPPVSFASSSASSSPTSLSSSSPSLLSSSAQASGPAADNAELIGRQLAILDNLGALETRHNGLVAKLAPGDGNKELSIAKPESDCSTISERQGAVLQGLTELEARMVSYLSKRLDKSLERLDGLDRIHSGLQGQGAGAATLAQGKGGATAKGTAKSADNAPAAVCDDINAVQARQEQLAHTMGLVSSAFCQAPSDYYSWELEQRRELLGAPSVHHLWKSVIMHNSKCPHTNFSDPLESKYYMVIVQYTASVNNELIIKALRALQTKDKGQATSKKKLNFRLCPGEVSQKLSGFGHNAVSPLGMTERIPILLSHRATQQGGFMWMGGGHVDLKWRCDVDDFVRVFDPLVINFTDK